MKTGVGVFLLPLTLQTVWMAQRLGDRAYSGYWENPGGEVEPGETEKQAAVREVLEETGLVISEDDLTEVFDGPITRPCGEVYRSVNYAMITGLVPTLPEKEKHKRTEWVQVHVGAIKDLRTFAACRAIFGGTDLPPDEAGSARL